MTDSEECLFVSPSAVFWDFRAVIPKNGWNERIMNAHPYRCAIFGYSHDFISEYSNSFRPPTADLVSEIPHPSPVLPSTTTTAHRAPLLSLSPAADTCALSAESTDGEDYEQFTPTAPDKSTCTTILPTNTLQGSEQPNLPLESLEPIENRDLVSWITCVLRGGSEKHKSTCLLCGSSQISIKRHLLSTHLIVKAKYRTPTRFDRLAPIEQGLILINTANQLQNPTADQAREIRDILSQRWICPQIEPDAIQIYHGPIPGFDPSRYPHVFEAFRSTYGPKWRAMFKCPRCKGRFTRGSSLQRHSAASGTCGLREDYNTDEYPSDSEEFKSTERGASSSRRRNLDEAPTLPLPPPKRRRLVRSST